ncbi:MAG: hypothetical protein V4563_14150 [Pseudomonadota bacterium]
MSDEKESVLDRIERESDALFAQQNMATAAAAVAATKPVAPAPGAEPIPPAPDPDDLVIDGKKVDMPEPSSPEMKQGWKTWKGLARTKIVSLEAKIAEMDKRLTEAPKAEVKPFEDKIAALEKERQELAERLGQVSLERTPEFQKHFTGKLQSEIKSVREAVGDELADRVEAVLTMPESKHKRDQLNLLYAELDESQKGDVIAARKAIMDTMRERDRELADWKTNIEARNKTYQERETAAQTVARQKFESAFGDRLAAAQKELSVLQAKEGDAEWNQRIERDIAEAKDLFVSADPTKRAGAAILAATHRTALAQLEAAQAEIQTLKKHIEATQAKTPTVKGGGDVKGGQPTVLPGGQPESLAERMARLAGEQGFLK